MQIGSPVRFAVAAFLAFASPAAAQQGSGDGFLFRAPAATFTVRGGFDQALASGGVFSMVTRELTLGRSDFGAGNLGGELAFSASPRVEIVFGIDRATSSAASEYRDWVDNNNLPIEQRTRLDRTPFTAGVRYYLSDRGRRVGSIAWIPARFTPFVGAGAGFMKYRFEQTGDFVDAQTLDVFTDKLTSRGWTPVMQASAGAQWSLNQRMNLTGELRYQHANGEGGSNGGEFSGYKLNLSGVSTSIGLTFRL